MYREIDFIQLIETLQRLENRIMERFPDSGLMKVCQELNAMVQDTQTKLVWVSKPNLWLRSIVAVVIALVFFLIAYSFLAVDFTLPTFQFAELIQVAESAVNEVILIGAALFFLVTLEAKLKRSRILTALNELRAVAHVIDMHQLTKDPTEIGEGNFHTKSSPKRNMTPYQLKRYLDYCSEMLSLVGKVAAVYAQKFPESDVVSAVNEVENLTTGLSRKVWQKLIILEQRTLVTN